MTADQIAEPVAPPVHSEASGTAGAPFDSGISTAVTEPGVYTIPEADYHRDPVPGGSLSCSEARKLLESPAKFHWARTVGGEEHKATFDFGKAAHALVLGVGCEVLVLDFPDWKRKAAQEARDEAYANGITPLLAKDWATVEAMAAALRAHELAAALLNPERGVPEQSLFWWDSSGVMLRSRLDWLPTVPETGRLIVPDYKTAAAADHRSFGKSAASYGYHQQAAWYLDGVAAVLGVHDSAFVFVVQEKDPPYLVNVIELTASALAIGAERNRAAIELYVDCTERNHWPGYGPGVELAQLPRWAEIQHEEDYNP